MSQDEPGLPSCCAIPSKSLLLLLHLSSAVDLDAIWPTSSVRYSPPALAVFPAISRPLPPVAKCAFAAPSLPTLVSEGSSRRFIHSGPSLRGAVSLGRLTISVRDRRLVYSAAADDRSFTAIIPQEGELPAAWGAPIGQPAIGWVKLRPCSRAGLCVKTWPAPSILITADQTSLSLSLFPTVHA